MKEKFLKILKSKTLFAIGLNLIFLVLCVLLTSFSYENTKDFHHSILIGQQHFYYSNTINYILAAIVGMLQYSLADFNCYVLVQILLSFMAFCSISFVFADKYNLNLRKAVVFSVVLNTIFALNHYSVIESNKTSALLLLAGFLLVLNAIRNKRYSASCWVGVLEIIFGSFLNRMYFFVALGFAVAFFLGDMIAKKKYRLKFRIFFWYFRPFLLMFLLITLICAGLMQFSYSVNHATEEATNYYDYEMIADSVDALPFPDYEKHIEEFKTVDINSESEYELLKNGYYDPQNGLDTNALRLVNEIQRRENSKTLLYAAGSVFTDMFSNMISPNVGLLNVVVYLALSLIFIIYHKNRFSFFPLFYALVGFVTSVLLRYLNNGADYLIYGVWLFMITLLLYSFNFEVLRSKKPSSKLRMSNGYFIISSIVAVGLIGCYITLFLLNTDYRKDSDAPKHLISEISRNPDCYYVMDTVSNKEFVKYSENYIHPLWGFRKGYLENLDTFGYFHNDEMLRKRNLPENIYQSVVGRNKMYVIDKNITFKKEQYFTENYADGHRGVVYNQLKELDGYKIYELVYM